MICDAGLWQWKIPSKLGKNCRQSSLDGWIFHWRLYFLIAVHHPFTSIYLIWSRYLNRSADLGLLFSASCTGQFHKPLDAYVARLSNLHGLRLAAGCWVKVKWLHHSNIFQIYPNMPMEIYGTSNSNDSSETTNKLCSYWDTRTGRSWSGWPRHGTSLFCRWDCSSGNFRFTCFTWRSLIITDHIWLWVKTLSAYWINHRKKEDKSWWMWKLIINYHTFFRILHINLVHIYIYIDCISFTHFKRNTKQTPCITASLAPTFSARWLPCYHVASS